MAPSTPPPLPPALPPAYVPLRPPPRPHPPSWRDLPWKPILAVVVAGVALLALLWGRCGLRGCPDVDRLGALQPDGAPRVLDREGEEVGELRLAEQRMVELSALPDHLVDAFLAVEDKRFREHHGVDWRRVGGALLANVRAGGIREGSSTLTMQLARNLFAERLPASQRTLGRKLLEVRVARAIERAYEKDEILELYLNHIYFGGGTRGIEAAAQYYFRKPAADLRLHEAALLAGLPKAPTHYDPRRNPERARGRRDLVLSLMAEQGLISGEQAAAAQDASLGVRSRGRRTSQPEPFAGYFLERVREELEERFGDSLYRGRVRIVTTLDRDAQRAAERELEGQLTRIEGGTWGRFRGPRYAPDLVGDEEGTEYLQGAVVLMEAETGEVLAWVGGRELRHSRFDRAAHARRQLGSAFKPFVFAAAIGAGVPPTQRLSDLPLTIMLGHNQVWEPRNFGDSYLPSVNVRQALVESRNVATIRLAETVGMRDVADLAQRAGLERVSRVPAAVLGTDTASPLQLARAYSVFATLGRRVEPRFIRRIENEDGEVLWEAESAHPEEVLDPAVAYVVTDMLREAVRSGTGAPAALGMRVPAAGKTGTTNDRHDVWFVGFTPDVVGAVWIGFDQPRSIVPGASGGRLAAPVWGRILRALYRQRPRPDAWPVPSGVTIATVDAASGAVVAEGCPPPTGRTYREAFLRGTAPPAVCPGGDQGLWARLRGWWGSEAPIEPIPETSPTPVPVDLPTLPPYVVEGTESGLLDPYGPAPEAEPLTADGPLLGLPPLAEELPTPPATVEPVEVEPQPPALQPPALQPPAPAAPRRERGPAPDVQPPATTAPSPEASDPPEDGQSPPEPPPATTEPTPPPPAPDPGPAAGHAQA